MSDTVKSSPPSFRSFLWLFGQILKASPILASGWIFLVLINAGIGTAELLVMRDTINSLVAVEALRGTIPLLTMLCILFFAQQAISTLLPLLQVQLRIKAGFALQKAALQKTSKLSLEAFDADESHNLISRVVMGGDSHAIALMQNGMSCLELLPLVLTSAFILGMISVWIPIIIVSGALLMRFFEFQLGARVRHFDVENTRSKRLSEYYSQLLTERHSAAENRLWGIGEILIRRWHETLTEYLNGQLRLYFQIGYQGVICALLFTGIIATVLLIASRAQGSLEAGLAALAIKALWNVCGGMNSIQYYIFGFVQHAGYGEDLRYLLERYQDEGISAKRSVHPAPIRDGIRLHGVEYRYPGADTNALSEINLNIQRGEILAIVGENGAGKTTLAHILAGLRAPTVGHVTWDGVDIATIPPDVYRSACTMVFQHPARYFATLRENVALNNAGVSDERVLEVLTRVGLAKRHFPLDVFLGPEFGGIDVSGGEWQRIAIARSLLKKETEFVIFDEPTAALDPLAELEVFERFVELVDGKTTLLVAHRLGPTRLANRVVVLENGRLVEVGTPTELIERKGKYTEMFSVQSEWYQ